MGAGLIIILLGAVLCIVPLIVGAIGAVVGWGTFFSSFGVLKNYIPSKAARILLMILWIGTYLFFAIMALSDDPSKSVYWIPAIAAFWIPAIIIWILAKNSEGK